MTQVRSGSALLGCPQKGTLRLLSPFQLTHSEVTLLPEKFCPAVLFGRKDTPLLHDAVCRLMGLSSEIIELVPIRYFALDVIFNPFHSEGELGRIARTLIQVCSDYRQPLTVVGSSQRELAFH